MGNKRFRISDLGFLIYLTVPFATFGADVPNLDMGMEDLSAVAVMAYEPAGSLFQQITDLEQEKILMQLEKEAAQLDLELDRLAAEKIKLSLEIDTLVGRSEEQQMALEEERARLEAEAARLERERTTAASAPARQAAPAPSRAPGGDEIGGIYRLVDIVGVGGQLEATLEYLSTGQRRKVSVGQEIEGGQYKVKSISLDDGVVFEKDGENHRLNVGK